MHNKIALFLDVDGVLNQYRISERIRRHTKWMKDKTLPDAFDPFPKKAQRLGTLVKKYNMDVYVFSAWKLAELQPHLSFELKGDTRKQGKNINDIIKDYDISLLIDDENSVFDDTEGRYNLDSSILMYQVDGDLGLIKKDFKNIERILDDYFRYN